MKNEASETSVAMPEVLAALLKEYLATWQANPEGFLFLNARRHLFSQDYIVRKKLWPILDAIEIPRCGLHAFRHAHASLLVDVGANPKVTQEQMRHSDVKITLGVYGHVIGNAQREAVEKVGEMLRPDAKLCAQIEG